MTEPYEGEGVTGQQINAVLSAVNGLERGTDEKAVDVRISIIATTLVVMAHHHKVPFSVLIEGMAEIWNAVENNPPTFLTRQ